MENLLNLFLPSKCITCGEVGNLICPFCLSRCENIVADICIVCEKPSIQGLTHERCKEKTRIQRFITVFNYDKTVRKVIKNAKYGGKQFLALKLLAKYGINLLSKEALDFMKDSVLVSIPLNKAKEKKRGFNQVDMLCSELSLKTKSKVLPKLLIRVKETSSQFENDRATRFANLKEAFSVDEKLAKGYITSRIVIVDDICTTGATLFEAAKTLSNFGFTDISAFTLSKRFKYFM